ncbi:protein sneaky-like [Arctopsyche grandis]|uniref:protein sneaky-like n=1 Tax=Arctopsyche grandis TaxID=121162 RepID=UPI00406D6332
MCSDLSQFRTTLLVMNGFQAESAPYLHPFGLNNYWSMTLGNTFSIQFRCISALVVPSFCSNAGKNILHALILTYLVAGPVNNMVENTHEIVRIITCSSSLNYNFTKAKLDLMMNPFVAATLKMKPDLAEINDTLKSIDGLITPITAEIESNGTNKDFSRSSSIESDKYERNYVAKVESKSLTKCEKIFAEGYDKCFKKVFWIAGVLFCWPMELGVVCNLVDLLGTGNMCDASKSIDPSLGQHYEELLNRSKSFNEDFQNANLTYKMRNGTEQMLQFYDTKETTKNLVETVLKRKAIVEYVLQVLHIIFAILFLKLILVAQNYHDNYRKHLNFDNKYVTYYFCKIDERRKVKEKSSLLPMNKIERNKTLYANISLLTNVGCVKILTNILKAISNMLMPTVIILLDRFFYEILCIIRKHGEIEYYDVGSHNVSVKIKGSGMMASLVKSMIAEFNQTSNINSTQSNLECLPSPSQLPNVYLWIIYSLFLLMFLLSISNLYINHFCRLICAKFYPKHEKRRILGLYNGMLKKRCIFYANFKKKRSGDQEYAMRHNEYIAELKKNYPRLSVCVRYNCIICGESNSIQRCNTCKSVYCSTCWSVVNVCYICVGL